MRSGRCSRATRPKHVHDRKAAQHASRGSALTLRRPGRRHGAREPAAPPDAARARARRRRARADRLRAAARSERRRRRAEERARPGRGARGGAGGRLGRRRARRRCSTSRRALEQRARGGGARARSTATSSGRSCRCCCEMERAGIRVDRGAMEGMSVEFGRAMQDLEARIHARGGPPVQHRVDPRARAGALRGARSCRCVKRLKTGPVHRSGRPREARRAARAAAAGARAPGALEAEGHLRRRAAAARRPRRRPHPHHVPPGGRGDRPALLDRPEPAEHPDPHRAVAPDPRGVRRAGGAAAPLRRLLADRAPDPGALLGGPGARSRRSATREDVHTRTAAETFGVAPARGHARHAPRREGAQLRDRLRPLGVRPLAAARPRPARRRRRSSTATSRATRACRRYIDEAVEDARERPASRGRSSGACARCRRSPRGTRPSGTRRSGPPSTRRSRGPRPTS